MEVEAASASQKQIDFEGTTEVEDVLKKELEGWMCIWNEDNPFDEVHDADAHHAVDRPPEYDEQEDGQWTSTDDYERCMTTIRRRLDELGFVGRVRVEQGVQHRISGGDLRRSMHAMKSNTGGGQTWRADEL